MSGTKIIDLDTNRRLSKEALEDIKKTVDSFTIDNLENIMVIYVDKEGAGNVECYGIDWSFLGLSQAYLEQLRTNFLSECEVDPIPED